MVLCTEKIALSLEDDAPVTGTRAVFKVDIMNPCWLFKGADLSKASALVASVGQAPFNFQIGDAVKEIPLHRPATPEGELEVRVDDCNGERIAVLPLAPAAGNFAVTTLPAASIKPREGLHDLCLTFTRKSIDPIWTIDSIELKTTRAAGTE
jgi:hexosaminidase